MSFTPTTPLGGYNNQSFGLGPVPVSAGGFHPSTTLAPGAVALVGVTIEGGTSVAAAGLTVTDTKSNVYTLIDEIDFGGNVLAVYGSTITTFLEQGDEIRWQTANGFFIVAAVGLTIANVSLTVDSITSAASLNLSSGAAGATGDAFVGFSAFQHSLTAPPATANVSGWDTPSAGYQYSINDGGGGSLAGIFCAQTYAKTAQTYDPTFSFGSNVGSIVVALAAKQITGTMATTEHKDHLFGLGVTQADPWVPQYGPFYFAYVDDDTVPFDPTIHNRFDEDIFDFEIKHDEGQVPTMNITIKNPRVGLLSAGRKLWAYLSYQPTPGGTITPIFFGVLVGIPSDFFAELITLQFNARGASYIEQKQAVAETLKVTPYYDPVFLDLTHRDDPDAILEGWSSLYHVDRVTLDVSASDILEGEDGTVTFDETQGIYDSVKMTLGECPLYNVQVQADVKWTQRCIGYIAGPSANIQSYTGGSFKGDWPKPGANLGGGWKVESSYVLDVLDTDHARTFSVSSNWKNQDPDSDDCSTATMSYSATTTLWPGIAIEGTGARQTQTGICDPFGDPPLNVPAKVATSGTMAVLWILNCQWSLRYDAKRDFTEIVVMDIKANLQQTFVSPTVDQGTELIKISGADVGQPLETPFAWSDFANEQVNVATTIFPNDPLTPGGRAYQICVSAGIAGAVEPVFSDIPGTLTLDGTVVWASLGDSPPQTQPEWTSATPIATGEIIVVEPKVFNIVTGDMETTGASYFFLCVRGGTTNGAFTEFEYIPAASSSDDGPAQPVPFSVILGPGDSAFSNIGGGGSGAPIPATGGQTTDGSVQWVNLGTSPPYLGIPIGGTITNVTARSYYPTARGLQSIEYLICKARARIRLRSRCVKVEWDAPFEDCIGLSCRMNATIYDPRLPGGAATGKVTSYTLSADKEGKLIGHVEIGVSVGLGNSVPAITGTPEYTAATGYMEVGYQAYDGGQFVTAEEDVGYTPPVFQAFDDGLVFPLQFFPGTLTITHPIQSAQIAAAVAVSGSPQLGNVPAVQSALNDPRGPGATATLLGGQSAIDWLSGGEGTYLLECDPVAAEILIDSVTNGPFNGAYYVTVSELELPQGINLSAASSP